MQPPNKGTNIPFPQGPLQNAAYTQLSWLDQYWKVGQDCGLNEFIPVKNTIKKPTGSEF